MISEKSAKGRAVFYITRSHDVAKARLSRIDRFRHVHFEHGEDGLPIEPQPIENCFSDGPRAIEALRDLLLLTSEELKKKAEALGDRG